MLGHRREPFLSMLIILALLLAIGIVGGMDAEDEQKEQEFFCKMVEQGVWPDYNESYQSKCPQEGSK